MRVLWTLTLLVTTLFSASTIVSYDVKPNIDNGSVDVEVVFDRPYEGEVRKSRAEEKIVLDLDRVKIATKTVKEKVSPILSRFTITPLQKRTEIIADVSSEVTLQTVKSADMKMLQLHFSGPITASTVPDGLDSLSVEEAADPSTDQEHLTGKLRIVTIFAILLLGIGWVFLRKKKLHMTEIRQLRWRKTLKSSFGRLKERLRAFTKGHKRAKGVKKRENRFSKYLKVFNPRNKILTLLAALVIIAMFVPKINLYYQFEHLIKPYGVIVSGEELQDKRLWLRIVDGVLYYEQIESAKIEKIDIMLFVLFNQIKATNIHLSSTLEGFVPGEIEEMTLRYSVLDPLRVTLKGRGDFGELSGALHLRDRTAKVTIYPSKAMKRGHASTLKTLKADGTGGYYYESRF